MFKKLEAPILYVNDVRESIDFYVKHLGFTIVDDAGDFVTLSLGETRVALNKGNAKDKFPGHQTIILVSDSIEKDYQALSLVGIQMDMSLSDPGYGKTFIFRDPDGNKIEIIE